MRMVYFLETGGALAGNPAALDEFLGRDWSQPSGIWTATSDRTGIDWNRLLGLATMLTVSAAGWTGVAFLIAYLWR